MLFRIALLGLGGMAACLQAKDAQQPSAKVLGPQSPVETYNAPVQPAGPLEGVIDFPKLIAAPGPNDALEITPALAGMRLEIVGTSGGDTTDAFAPIAGTSRVANPPALYAALRARLDPWRGRRLTLGDVRRIQQDIAAVYHDLGYPLMSVTVPPQEIVGQTLRVQINEFRLARWHVVYQDPAGRWSSGAKHWSRDSRLKALLDPLLAEPILDRSSLDAAVKTINRNPYRQARVVFEPGAARGQTDATVQVEEKRPWSLEAGYNNYATKASGTDRFSLGGSLGNLPVEDQQLSWNATVGPRIDQFQNYSLIYTVPLAGGRSLTANLNYSDTASSTIPGINSASTTSQASLAYALPLLETKAWSWSLEATGLFKRFERESIFGSVTVGGASFDSAQLQLNSQFNWRETTATNQIVVGTVLSLAGVTGRNSDAAFRTFYNSATGRAGTQQFSLNYARVQQLGPLLKPLDGWSTETQVSWQFADQELAGSDAFSIGGPSVLRAYPSSAVNGDQGAYVVQMLHVKPWSPTGPVARFIRQVELAPLVETGWAHYVRGGSEHLWDAGVQAQVAGPGGLSVNASVAWAGRDVGPTRRGGAHAFVAARYAY